MGKPLSFPAHRNEKSVPYREKPNRTWICTYSSGRLQSEMSFTNRRRVTASTHLFYADLDICLEGFRGA